jgi:hypothetical protein
MIVGTNSKGKPDYIPRAQYAKMKREGLPLAVGPTVKYIDYEPRGAIKDAFKCKALELILAGPAGTGKSRGALEKCNWLCDKYKEVRGIMIRKTRRSLTQSVMVTFEKKVIVPGSCPFHGGDQEYRYSNGSIFAVAGIDDPKKIYSSEWDFAYVNQAEELDEDDWESILSRLRNWKMPYQQLLGDVNPAEPGHWLRQRALTQKAIMLESRHEDNPELFNGYCIEHGVIEPDWTCRGKQYLGQLDCLTGVRYKRLRKGIWAAAEGTVYEESWDRAVHIIDRFVTSPLNEDQVPASWPRYWVVDFGYTNPFVWQAWAEDPDGRLYRYKEIYKTKGLVEDHARTIRDVTKNDPRPSHIICDHDAEDRATLERHLGMRTEGAWKAVSAGIQAVEGRLRKAGDGKPRIFYLRDSVIDLDQELLRAHLPACTEDEYDVYVWDTSNNRKRGEEPVKKYDHGQDATRYMVTKIDKTSKKYLAAFPMISVNKSGDGSGGGDNSLTRGSSWRLNDSNGLGNRWRNE